MYREYTPSYLNLEAYLILLDYGYDPININDLYVFGIDDLILYFFKKFEQIAINEFNILKAIERHFTKTILYAIERGADVTKTNNFKSGTLHFAAKYNIKEIVKPLISRGVDINAEDKYGRTPLYYAREYNPEIAELLISNGTGQ
ncbi:ankyrin repeat protein, putative [Trichomonas vaginalis G3]|uniref:Ankyrin repeat protein, putative n=1 Tax=Trichomonas vaginalis (strain ATCC PRA-98 / G3) TaxID=412133 RepID=A2F9F3_TRIV3|nr:Ankyrin repeat family [Trichomonas vaginalis G3]EAX98472.1 ankyrin repeat protein, putative [Trichomonas vaginalis G3]KAI5492756.1 Ankyrin repeat family [Trichomonas vaginalis G3]|eukprot:XP_001311402.1 ankyrin repeat protein [Trichomonas vaginalis G3]